MQHPNKIAEHLKDTLTTYVYSHCNICNIQMKQIQHPDEIYEACTWNAYAGVELDTHGHPSREQQMVT
jgi:hypothetical protein